MTIQSTFPTTDLVLRLTGGQRDGELIPVSTNKCFLGMEESSDGTETPQCAIFRGPRGAAVKSYGKEVLVNGAAVAVQWLQEGDRIEFPNSMAIEVAQLGWVDQPCEEYTAVEGATVPVSAEPSDEELDVEPEAPCSDCEDSTCPSDERESETCQSDGCHDVYYQEDAVQEETPCEPVAELPAVNPIAEITASNQGDERLGLIESQIKDIQTQNGQTQERFDNLDGQLGQQLSQLVSMVSSNVAAEPSLDVESDEEVFVNELPASPEVESDEEVFVNQLPASPEVESEAEPVELATNVEFKDAVAALDGASQGEIDSRLAEMERVFGGQLAEIEDESDSPVLEQVEHDFETSQSADEQLAETFETKSHSLDEEVASFADNTMAYGESLTTRGAESFSDFPLDEVSLAKQLIMEVDQAQENTLVEDAVEEAAVEETTAQETSEEALATPYQETVEEEIIEETSPEEPPKSESVSDLLARMKAEGQWEGVPNDELKGTPVEPIAVEPVAESPVEQPLGGEASGEDVDDYMSQLLSRMRGDAPAATHTAPAAYSSKSKPEEDSEEEEVVFVPPTNPLKADEFKPKQKAKQINSLSAMRELANSSARSAVRQSESTRRKALGFVQVGTALSSFLMACYYMLVSSTEILDTPFIAGVACIAICGLLCFRFYDTMRKNELKVKSGPAKTDENATPEQAAELTEA